MIRIHACRTLQHQTGCNAGFASLSRSAACVFCCLIFLCGYAIPVQAAPAASYADAGAAKEDLDRLQGQISLSDETLSRLRREVATLVTDRDRLKQQLVEAGSRVQKTEAAVLAAEARLAVLDGNEERIRVSLGSRKGALVEVLATLQRMGRHPPPAMLVTPDDALTAVRTSMLLGAIVPEMRQETEALIVDLRELQRVRKDIVTQRDSLKQALQTHAEERIRTQLLVEERQKVLVQEQTMLASEQAHATQLAQEAATLKDLVARMDREIDSAVPEKSEDAASRLSLAALQNPGRLAPARAFADSRGMLKLPVVGTVLRTFGADDGSGGKERGLTLKTSGDASVTAPCDGSVIFAGPFRSYRQLLIIHAGEGYLVVMTGMDRISVVPGQFVLTGEPVAVMGIGEGADSSLYIEFRKDGVSIDPTPWWSSQGEKARG